MQELPIGVDVIVGLDVIVEHGLTVGDSKKDLNMKIGMIDMRLTVDQRQCELLAMQWRFWIKTLRQSLSMVNGQPSGSGRMASLPLH